MQEAELSWVICLGSIVDRGRTERLRRDTFSCPGRLSAGSGDSKWAKRPGGRVAWGRTFEDAVRFALEYGRTVRVLVDSSGR